jgi:hypothetical protein
MLADESDDLMDHLTYIDCTFAIFQ